MILWVTWDEATIVWKLNRQSTEVSRMRSVNQPWVREAFSQPCWWASGCHGAAQPPQAPFSNWRVQWGIVDWSHCKYADCKWTTRAWYCCESAKNENFLSMRTLQDVSAKVHQTGTNIANPITADYYGQTIFSNLNVWIGRYLRLLNLCRNLHLYVCLVITVYKSSLIHSFSFFSFLSFLSILSIISLK